MYVQHLYCELNSKARMASFPLLLDVLGESSLPKLHPLLELLCDHDLELHLHSHLCQISILIPQYQTPP
jgi:hypothetical protein